MDSEAWAKHGFNVYSFCTALLGGHGANHPLADYGS